MQPDERKRLTASAGAGMSWTFPLFAAAVVGTFAMLVGTVAFALLTGIRGEALVTVAVILFLGGSALAWRSVSTRSKRMRQAAWQHYAADMLGDEVEEWQVGIRDAIRVEEFEDEGSQYFLELDDGRVIFLMGQYLYEHEAAKRFPCTALRLVRLPHSHEIIEIECQGTPLAASAVRSHFTDSDHQAGRVPEDGAILEGPLSRYRDTAADGRAN